MTWLTVISSRVYVWIQISENIIWNVLPLKPYGVECIVLFVEIVTYLNEEMFLITSVAVKDVTWVLKFLFITSYLFTFDEDDLCWSFNVPPNVRIKFWLHKFSITFMLKNLLDYFIIVSIHEIKFRKLLKLLKSQFH